MSETKLLERLERVLLSRGWEQDSDGAWVRPPDHPGQLRRVRRESKDLVKIIEHLLASRFSGSVREDLRTVLYAQLIEYGWRVDGLRIRDSSGQLRQARAAFRDALAAGW